MSTADINHIGNYRFVGATDNIRKRAELPDRYFSRLKTAEVDVGPHLLVPRYTESPSELEFSKDAYLEFRDSRLKAIFEIANRVVNPELA